MEDFNSNHDLSQLEKENTALRIESKRLRSLLESHGIAWQEPKHDVDQSRDQLIRKRLELFRLYFRGRDDIYAHRWFKDGVKQYSPVIKKKFLDYDPMRKKRIVLPSEGESIYEPLTEDVIFRHLSKTNPPQKAFAIGLYVIVNDDECFLSVVDFDGITWQQDLFQVVKIIEEHGFPYMIERSQSGNGGHLWFFFVEAIKAKKARQFCSSLLTLAMQRCPTLKMDAYDRIFPTQDSITKKGFGNLIALPLEGDARSKGNSVFVDKEFNPFPDQWETLSNTRKLEERQIDEFLQNLGPNFDTGIMGLGAIDNPRIQDIKQLSIQEKMPSSLQITLKNGMHLPTGALPPSLVNRLRRIASFKNPEFYKAQQMRLSTWNKPRVITCAELEDDGTMVLPRGCFEAVKTECVSAGITLVIEDKRNSDSSFPFTFVGTLREEQQAAVESLAAHDNGVLSAPTGFGKTVIASALIAHLQTSVLIIVHTKPLLQQWVDRLKSFLREKDIPVEPGILGAGKDSLSGKVDIALINSLALEEHLWKVASYGLVIVDECHHVAAVSYERVMKAVMAKHVYGLTATPIRNDGHNDIIFMQCGSIIHQVDQAIWTHQQNLSGTVIPRFSKFRCDFQHLQIQEIYDKLTRDSERNTQIVEDIKLQVSSNRSILVLSTRIEQLSALEAQLVNDGVPCLVMSGSQSAKVKRKVQAYLEQMRESHIPALILSTGKYIGEGFDFPRLDTLIFASPIAWKGNVIQYVGRVSRTHEEKCDVLIVDYIDFKIPVFIRMFAKRVNAYKKIGFSVAQDQNEPKEKLLFSSSEYWEALEHDIVETAGPVIFSIPYLLYGNLKRHSQFLADMTKKKAIIMILRVSERATTTSSSNSWEQVHSELKRLGIEVHLTEDELANFILIGDRIVWYGSIHPFGKVEPDETVLRLEDPTYAADFKSLVSDFLLSAKG